MKTPIPIFIIVKDRLEVLKASIETYREQIDYPVQIVIHDNFSTYKPLLAYLEQLSHEEVIVYHNTIVAKNKSAELNSVKASIKRYCKSVMKKPDFYVVTDPDIALDNVDPDIFDFYTHTLNTCQDISVIGPHLRIDNIPDYYPLKSSVKRANRSSRLKKLETVKQYKNKSIVCHRFTIDTTFGMYRYKYRFKRKSKGAVRTGYPYEALHLDWYIDPTNVSADRLHYIKSANRNMSHWCNKSILN